MESGLPDERHVRRGLLPIVPFTYGHVWLWAALGVGVPILAIISVFGLINDWTHPWPQLVVAMPASGFVLNGVARSIWLRRLPVNPRPSRPC